MFQEYHNEAPDGLLRTTGVVAGLVSKIAKKFPNFEFPKKIQQFALSRTCFRMNALARKLAADRAETLKAKRKVLDFIYSSEPSKKGRKVSKVLFLQICLFENFNFLCTNLKLYKCCIEKASFLHEFQNSLLRMAMIQPSFTSSKLNMGENFCLKISYIKCTSRFLRNPFMWKEGHV